MGRYNVSGNGFITLAELKVMMERLGAPQTHLGLKAMMKEADQDGDGALSFRSAQFVISDGGKSGQHSRKGLVSSD